MIYNVETYYINSETDARLIRYDVIKLHSDAYQVKVFDDQQRGISHPSLVAQIDDFPITVEEYVKSQSLGFDDGSDLDMSSGFEYAIPDILQKHRNKLS
ncbi:hypothetical protein [Leclercia adecarboxylata]|uniref:hypothetical protein n=1 Tax=Leclercia adecarboxylata TaxID=83655 RepID=UPI0011DF6AFA|nr:hypothetical protein [Leclercia adecarboxylata]NEG91077.1 hypothetical protein [Leclercia adecarboxylata]